MTAIEIRVLNVGNAKGNLRVAICTQDQWLQGRGVAGALVPARAGVMTVTVPDVPPGVYGALAHHDANGNGKIDKDLLGRPTEGIGFSRDAPIWFGPPKFADAAFRLAGEPVVLEISLCFEPKPRRE